MAGAKLLPTPPRGAVESKVRTSLLAPVLLLVPLLGGCGAEVAGAAATAAKLQASQAQSAKATEEQVKKQLSEAMKTGEVAASAAGAEK